MSNLHRSRKSSRPNASSVAKGRADVLITVSDQAGAELASAAVTSLTDVLLETLHFHDCFPGWDWT